MPGTLLVVATPLGHLEDISPRAIEALRSVDLIACEDTRRTSKLLARYGIEGPTVSCHKFNERERLAPILDRLAGGAKVALVSDGGTPGISDPGALLVRASLERGVDVRPIPGPSAVAAILSVSGLPADRYVFEGFLPPRAGERRRRLRELRGEPRTIVLFEAPHRVLAALADIEAVVGPRETVLGRELTKLHETLLRGTPGQVAASLGPDVRGEITIALAGASESATAEPADADATRVLAVYREALETAQGDRRKALRSTARDLRLGRAELYRWLVELGQDPG